MFDVQAKIERLRAVGQEVCVAPPPACQALWERAQSDPRFHLGRLYVVNQALEEGTRGMLDLSSRDIWVLHDEQAPEETLRILLHELCHAKRVSEEITTLDAYWDEESEVIQEAFELAREWGLPTLFHPYSLLRDLRRVADWRTGEKLAEDLAGSAWLDHAQAVFQVVLQLGRHHQRDACTFEAALRGRHPNPRLNAAVVDVDRTCLREEWSPAATGGSLGTEALPQDDRSARLLRAALRSLTRPDGPTHWLAYKAGPAWSCVVRRLRAGQGLAPVLSAAQEALLSHPEMPAEVTWSLYSDAQAASERLYHLSVTYWDQPEVHVWVRASREVLHDLRVEAAWQRYILSWRAHTQVIYAGSLEQGYHQLHQHRRRKRRHAGAEAA